MKRILLVVDLVVLIALITISGYLTISWKIELDTRTETPYSIVESWSISDVAITSEKHVVAVYTTAVTNTDYFVNFFSGAQEFVIGTDDEDFEFWTPASTNRMEEWVQNYRVLGREKEPHTFRIYLTEDDARKVAEHFKVHVTGET